MNRDAGYCLFLSSIWHAIYIKSLHEYTHHDSSGLGVLFLFFITLVFLLAAFWFEWRAEDV